MSNDTLKTIENKFHKENIKIISLLIPIGIISFLIKSYYFEPEIPLTFDSLKYFLYATDISILGHLPTNYFLANNLWAIFLSIFFQLFQFENTIQYMDLQKQLSMILSTITIIPIYFLCKKFFKPKYAIIGALIFALEPRLIHNSMLGITESLYILLGTITLLFFLSSNKKLIYISFLFVGLTTLVRAEGQMIFFVISAIFFIRFRKEKLVIPKYIIALGIFVLTLTPMLAYQLETQHNDSIFGRAAITILYHTQDPSETGGGSGLPFFIQGIENFSKFFLWDLIPIFIFFVPIGIFYLFQKYDFRKLTLILCGVGISIPAFYAYSIPLLDTRYLFMLYPIFCVISLFTIQKISNHFSKKNIVLGLIIIIIFLSSSIFLEMKPLDNKQKLEAYQIVKEISKNVKVMNSFYPEDQLIQPSVIPEKWIEFKKLLLTEQKMTDNGKKIIATPITLISTEGYTSLNEFLEQNPHITHIYVDEKTSRADFLRDIFEHEDKYYNLEKQFDSKERNYDYHVKIFKIDK
jgi:hypothetical protein|tara:strand:- start:1690 stop:3252 length:1563 start_codon:yes stop_codon:yes gene_type:complete